MVRNYTVGRIGSEANSLLFIGPFRQENLLSACAALHSLTHIKSYQEIILDFANCTSVFSAPILGLCAKVVKLRAEGIDFKIIFPIDKELARLIRNANWAHLLCPSDYSESIYRGYGQMPAREFIDPSQQYQIIDEIMSAIMGVMPLASRGDLAALEWSLNEIMDNVFTHAESELGGLIQFTHYASSNKIEYVIADAGKGIPNTLKSSNPKLKTDAETLEYAIREGVTRDKSLWQGNGLFGSFEICSHSGGVFGIQSGYGKLFFSKSEVHSRSESIPYDGTLINATIDLSIPHLLEQALKFGGQIYHPTDYIELHYEALDEEKINVILKTESASFGTRPAGTPVRNRLLHLVKGSGNRKIYVDFTGITLLSSSFADEVFGKLFVEIGAISFMRTITLINVSPIVSKIIDRAIMQRCAAGSTEV
jgi:hypothetical protein